MAESMTPHSTSAIFKLDSHSGVPTFQQLQHSVVNAVATGQLVPGAKLPTVRGLATELGLAANTVAAAYRALEADGIVEGRGRSGTFVRLDVGGENPVETEARRLALETAQSLIRLGISLERAQSLIAGAYGASESRRAQ